MVQRLLLSAAFCLQICAIQVLAENAQIPIFQSETQNDLNQATRIAIIGAGAGGSSTAYHLRKFADEYDLPLNITVFEKSSYVGGRSTTVNVLDDPAHPVELGASIFVQANKILYDAVQELGLPTDDSLWDDDPAVDDALGIWDGKGFIYRQSKNGLGWWDMAKMFWRYGFAPMRTQSLMNSTVSSFLKMYTQPMFPWTSINQAAQETGLLDFTATTGEEKLKQHGIGSRWAREIVQSSTRVNYGQNLVTIHSLEAMVCMATDNAMSVRGGNWKIFDGMLERSKAHLRLNTTVTEITRAVNSFLPGPYIINSKVSGSSDGSIQSSDEFDVVILAAPAQFADISIANSEGDSFLQSPPDEIPYVSLHVTLLATPNRLSPAYFGLIDNLDQKSDVSKGAQSITVPQMVLTTLSESENKSSTDTGIDGAGQAGFWSVNHIHRIEADTYNKLPHDLHVYKIFSPAPLDAQFVSKLFDLPLDESAATATNTDSNPFSSISKSALPWHYTKQWYSYPYLFPRVTFEELRLDGDAGKRTLPIKGSLWYTSGIESFISTMETSALAGMNIARLIVDRVHF